MIKLLVIGTEVPGVEAVDASKFDVSVVPSGAAARDSLAADPGGFDAIVLGPTGDSETAKMLAARRDLEFRVPIIAVLENASAATVAEALHAGADECVPNAVEPDELVARITAITRCNRIVPILRVGELRIDFSSRAVRRGELQVNLTPKEFDFLSLLLRDPGQPVPRAEIFKRVWNYDSEPESPILEVLVNRLRQKLRILEFEPIEKAPDAGYALMVPGRSAPSTPSAIEASESSSASQTASE